MKSYLPLANVPRPIMRGLLGIAALALVSSGCSSGPELAHNANGNVYLEEVADWTFGASHPAVIDQLTITKIIKGGGFKFQVQRVNDDAVAHRPPGAWRS